MTGRASGVPTRRCGVPTTNLPIYPSLRRTNLPIYQPPTYSFTNRRFSRSYSP
ncbi:MAG: hypothetical protein V9H69_08495 [Anaerolineae bacterium]